MSSINLLPKDFKPKNTGGKKQSNKLVLAISVLLVIISIASSMGLYFLNKSSSQEIESLNYEVETVGKEIEKSFSDIKLLSANNNVDDAIFLLSERVYFTKIIEIFQSHLIADVYLDSLDINFEKEGSLAAEFDGVAKDYTSFVSQIYLFKNNDIFKEVSIKNISINKESGYIDFQGSLEFKQSVFFYNK